MTDIRYFKEMFDAFITSIEADMTWCC